MNDRPQVDNPQSVSLRPPAENIKNPFSLDSKRPGPETRSTPVNLKDFAEQQTTADDPLIQALVKNMESEKSPPINNQPVKKIEKTKPDKQQQGFLTPFVNGFNNSIEAIWNAIKSLIPMKPQTGTGSA